MAGNRKNELRALFSGNVTPAAPAAEQNLAAPAETAAPKAVPVPVETPRAASGAIKAMGLSLGSITREAEEARSLREALHQGERVVELDPDLVDASFVGDRLTDGELDDPDFLALGDSIRENGQQSPILVRPHPEKHGRYQTAYGHRRLNAVRSLGIKVKAIVRPLTDDELVLAQGKENAERRNLSFIERALFASALVDRGFDRKVIGDALSVQKSELSRLIQVAESVPLPIARAIGPAPKVGRERWMAIGALLEGEPARQKAEDEISLRRFLEADSDRRFQLVFARLSRTDRQDPAKPEVLKDENGRAFAKLKRDEKSARIEFSPDVSPAFVDEAIELLAKHHAAFVAARRS
ncbi:plasmid partitioning protein RepB [Ensifer sp. HO-A22]|jgi:ParB family chromosome partitioning protein|uniref:Plasmid partitioning protein RepB n=1 Tax=Ensifer oleiphilus TaxID=2742698 RepID=A0A7Y6Q757_9HYPH|nr:plasmid partitioning protein RepB [Ensifer oleiphilus]NVD40105.1 plasmid partitioning protein RepB [Ensifer oleiphilus]